MGQRNRWVTIEAVFTGQVCCSASKSFFLSIYAVKSKLLALPLQLAYFMAFGNSHVATFSHTCAIHPAALQLCICACVWGEEKGSRCFTWVLQVNMCQALREAAAAAASHVALCEPWSPEASRHKTDRLFSRLEALKKATKIKVQKEYLKEKAPSHPLFLLSFSEGA